MKTKLVYVGLRIRSDDTVMQAFIEPGKPDALLFWRGVKYVLIGQLYEAERKRGGVFTINRKPKCFGEAEVDEKTLDGWRELEEVAEQRRRDKAAITRARNIQPSIFKALEPIRQARSKYRTIEELDSFDNMVIRCLRGRIS